jgi:hypothetical protein
MRSDVAVVVLAVAVAVLVAAVAVVSVAVVEDGTAAVAAMSADYQHQQEYLQLPHAVQSLYTAVFEAADQPVAVFVVDLLVIQTAASVLESVVAVAVVAEKKSITLIK